MGIRQLIPASSRSFWQLYEEVEALRSDVHSLEKALQAHDTHLKMMMWESMRKDSESLDETKKRFFESLPQAQGNKRVFQLALAQLLFEFDQLCGKNDIPYWVACGTALGLVRHGGFVPWDDDVDLGMLRCDIERLKELVLNNDRFQVTEYFDWYSKCRQVRFSYTEESVPCFLDLFIFDYSLSGKHDAFDLMQASRKQLLQRLESQEYSFWNEKNYLVDIHSSEGAILAREFDNAVAQGSTGTGAYIAQSTDVAEGIIWGVDNLDSWDNLDWIFPIEDYFPLRRELFEGFSVNAMAHIEAYLEEHFGNYYSLPKDIHSHFEHVKNSDIENDVTLEALERIANLRKNA